VSHSLARALAASLIAGALNAAVASASENWLAAYKGHPFVPNSPQLIPGPVKFAYYDQGGPDVAFHTSDAVNHGSGQLNPADGNSLNEFRIKEAVSISFTKGHDIDENPYGRCFQPVGSLYVGWTTPGEWLNYTVNVDKAGWYTVSLLYTANGDGRLGLKLDGGQTLGEIPVPSTHNDRDLVAWRQWHHWGRVEGTSRVRLPAGRHVLTVTVQEHGNMNLDTLEFHPAAL
jgi:hypothetical protein